MDNTSETNDGMGANAAHGLIKDYPDFKRKVSAEVKRLAAASKAWASNESTELFLFIFDEYIAQLDQGELPDAGDLREVINRYVNMNGVNNRLADAGLIVRQEKGSKKRVGQDLI